MTLYQIIDEQNHAIYAFESFEIAQQEAELLNDSREDHYYYVEPIEIS